MSAGPCLAGRPGTRRPWLDAEFGPKRHGSRLAHSSPSAFPSRRRRFPGSEYSSEPPPVPRGAFSEGNLCTRRDLCRFGPKSASNQSRQRLNRPAGQGPVGGAGGPVRWTRGPPKRPVSGSSARDSTSTSSCQFWFSREKRGPRKRPKGSEERAGENHFRQSYEARE